MTPWARIEPTHRDLSVSLDYRERLLLKERVSAPGSPGGEAADSWQFGRRHRLSCGDSESKDLINERRRSVALFSTFHRSHLVFPQSNAPQRDG